MYAIIEVGAKQHCVKKDDVIETEKIELNDGEDVTLDKVLLVVDDDKIEVGRPYLKNVSVKAKLLGQLKAKKVVSYKYRRRKSSHWKKGHRQKLTQLKIVEIKIG